MPSVNHTIRSPGASEIVCSFSSESNIVPSSICRPTTRPSGTSSRALRMPAGWLAGTWISGQWPARANVISRRSTSITP